MTRAALLAVTLLALAGCAGGGPGSDVRSGSAHLVLDSPHAGQVLTVRSVSVQARVEGVDGYRLHYYVDGADRGEGDTSFTIASLPPGNHRVEVEALHADGSGFTPTLRAGADFTIQ